MPESPQEEHKSAPRQERIFIIKGRATPSQRSKPADAVFSMTSVLEQEEEVPPLRILVDKDPEQHLQELEDTLDVSRKALLHGRRDVSLIESDLSRLHRATLIENQTTYSIIME